MTHIDPALAARVCTPAELEVVRLRNYQPPMSWTNCAELSGKTRGTVRKLWASANQKVNGGYVPPVDVLPSSEPLPAGYVRPKREQAGTARSIRATDPDVQKTWQGVPLSGAGRGAITGTRPGDNLRSGK